MKTKAFLATLVSLAALWSCCDDAGTTAKILEDAAENGTFLFGHQDDLMYGHLWTSSDGSDKDFRRSDVLDVSGDYPAVLGLDLGGVELGSECNLDGNNFDAMRTAARIHASRGGIVTLSWHARNILTGGTAWDIQSDKAVASCLPGGEKNREFRLWLSRVADYMESLDIPLIFRPWHEHSGSWFWWGQKLCTPEQYIALWKYTYDYMTRERNLKNLLWAISPDITDDFTDWTVRYPGDDCVDIVGVDSYCLDSTFATRLSNGLEFQSQFCKEHGKILAVAEVGYESLPDPSWWTNVLLPAINPYPVAYVLVWRNAYNNAKHFYTPFKGYDDCDDFINFYKSDKTVFLNDISK